MLDNDLREALTFDDVLLLPAESAILPREADVRTILTRAIKLEMPLISAAMDTVTEAATAICMAREGGIGIVHKNLSVTDQAREVTRVKKATSGMIVDPVTVHPDQKLYAAMDLMRQYSISGLPVVAEGQPVGILTNRDVRFERNLEQRVRDVMTTRLITAREGVSLEEAKELLHRNRIEKLLVVDGTGRLRGLITIKDIEKATEYPHAVKDEFGRLRVGAAMGVGADRDERAAALLAAGCDLICIDTAHGHQRRVVESVAALRQTYPQAQIVAGNVATAEGYLALARAGADAVKVGIGPGSICTTRVIAGVGVPQMTAIADCARARGEQGPPIIADGGIKYSGDVVKALAAGAHTIMIGSLFAGTDEGPGEVVLYQGRSYKIYRGMGSIGAMRAGSQDRYFQAGVTEVSKLVPEGIEGRVPYRGSLSQSIYQLLGGLRSGMGYTGCRTLDELREKARFVRITAMGLRESHVHDVTVTKEAPNYRAERD
jgi:IMP dehydrogenase